MAGYYVLKSHSTRSFRATVTDEKATLNLDNINRIRYHKTAFTHMTGSAMLGSNPRVLFFIDDRNKKRSVYLLSVAFLEKNKSDYDKAIDVALDRWKHVSDSMSKIED